MPISVNRRDFSLLAMALLTMVGVVSAQTPERTGSNMEASKPPPQMTCNPRLTRAGEVVFDIPTLNCIASVPPGTSVRVEFSPQDHACSISPSADPLPAIQDRIRGLAARISQQSWQTVQYRWTGAEEKFLEEVLNAPAFTFDGAIYAVNYFAGGAQGGWFAHRTSQKTIPINLSAPIDRQVSLAAGETQSLRWWCLNAVQLEQLWTTIREVAQYRRQMEAYGAQRRAWERIQ